jgi:hypothetical protein
MKRNPLEAVACAAAQELPNRPQGSLSCSKEPSIGSSPEPDQFSLQSLQPCPISVICILILSTHLCVGCPNGTSFSSEKILNFTRSVVYVPTVY